MRRRHSGGRRAQARSNPEVPKRVTNRHGLIPGSLACGDAPRNDKASKRNALQSQTTTNPAASCRNSSPPRSIPMSTNGRRRSIFPAHELFKKLGDLGFLGLNKPVEFGGQGLDYSYALMMAEELGAINCGGVPMAIGVQTDMATPALARFGSDEVRREFLAPAIAGDCGRLHRRVRSRAPAPTSPRSRPTRAPTATTTSSMAARCGSPTAPRPTGSACSPTPATARTIATSR